MKLSTSDFDKIFTFWLIISLTAALRDARRRPVRAQPGVVGEGAAAPVHVQEFSYVPRLLARLVLGVVGAAQKVVCGVSDVQGRVSA